MAAVSEFPMLTCIDSNYEVDKLTYEIFSILENKFLFNYDQSNPKHISNPTKLHNNDNDMVKSAKHDNTGKVRILSIDGGGATDGILAAKSLVHLESCLRRKSGNPNACIADFFDVVAGSGAGGILAALLFTRGRGGGPVFTADEALNFLVKNRRKIFRSSKAGLFRRIFGSGKAVQKLFRKTFGDCTMKDTLKSVLIPCYDLSSRAPFLFSRADALEMDGYDFKMSDVCAATSADPTSVEPVQMRSVDQRTRIVAVDGGIAMNNPTAAAITHVLNNKQEFPLCKGVEDLVVMSLGNGESSFGFGNETCSPSASGFVRIAGEGTSDLVDQSVSMAFGDFRMTNYVRIQANGVMANKNGGLEKIDIMEATKDMLAQKNVESVLFQGKKIAQSSNLEKIEVFSGDLVKEQERRKTSVLRTVVLKQMSPSPRTSSASTLSTLSSN
ncbi:patatin-like protein 7 [Ziziphus jujuba]|uniref:Patatin n=1 Tax=Ziziphus jujuba TaxID=326968 RepID=A0A6P4AE08_ZIZJJ|nr:patatin-like protein 7 [Ziziphus jujuba]